MEGVPRIPMLSFPMKRSADTPHFKSRLKSFISNHYNEDSESYGAEVHELESLRASAVHVSKDYSGCSTLKKYFCQLNFLKSRFPMNEGGTCAISFSWFDVFSETAHGWSDVDFEMSCILFNIGALHSELGALDNRQTADGMKTSCTHFQCAAWAFSHLRHNYQKYFTPDVSPDMLNILNNICLAQAQECILEKSLIDNRKSTITAKVALQIVEYYSTAVRIIEGMLKDAAQYSDKLIKAVKKWKKLVELKVQYYGCVAYLYRGMQAEDQGKWGERVTMYKAASEKLSESIKLGKNLEKTDPVHDTLHFTLDVVGGKVSIAEKENEFIYHEKVPELEAVMSDVKAVSLVKGIQFKFDDPQVAGPDIFGRLVPMEAHEASSLYSEEKAKILRTYSRKIEEKNEALDKFVLPLQLEQLELHGSDKIPQELIDCCAALSVNPDTVKRLSGLMANLSGLYHDVRSNLEEIQDHLADQEKKEKEYQEVVGKRPPNNIINEINRELEKYLSAQAVAAESNNNLREAMNTHVQNLSILMKPLDEVMKKIPNYDELEKNDEVFERMKKLSGKVSEMRKQREMLESQLRDSILNDDITKSLVVKKGEDLESVFNEELQKHDKITQLLDQNLLAQENIIRALTEANAEYAETRSATVELKRKRDTVIQSMIGSYEAYDELISKCNIGIEFYTKLNSNVEKLLQRMRSVCKVQNEEREINMERIIRKAQQPTVMPGVVPGMPTGIGSMSVAAYNSSAMHGGYTTYPMSTITPSIPTPTTNPVPSKLPPTSGGHLKLKDYLAMKKEGKTMPTSAVHANVEHNPAFHTPRPPVQNMPYDPNTSQQTGMPTVSLAPIPAPTVPNNPVPHMSTYDSRVMGQQTGMPTVSSAPIPAPTVPNNPVPHMSTYDSRVMGQQTGMPTVSLAPIPAPTVPNNPVPHMSTYDSRVMGQQNGMPTVSSAPIAAPTVPNNPVPHMSTYDSRVMGQQIQQPTSAFTPVSTAPTYQPSVIGQQVCIDNTSYSQTSFLAQYVRQTQGYLSSNQTPSSSSSWATYPNYTPAGLNNQNQIGYSDSTGYAGNREFPHQSNQNQFPSSSQYGQQQWQGSQTQPSHITPPSTNQQQSHHVPQIPTSYNNTESTSGYQVPQQQPQQYSQYGQPQHNMQTPSSNYYNPVPQQQQPIQSHSQPYQQNQNQYTQPIQQQNQLKPQRNSNMDLLSDIDFNALPAAAPLAPVVMHQTHNPSQNS